MDNNNDDDTSYINNIIDNNIMTMNFIKNSLDINDIQSKLNELELNNNKGYIDLKLDEMLNSLMDRIEKLYNNINKNNIDVNKNFNNLASNINIINNNQSNKNKDIEKHISILKKGIGSKLNSRILLLEKITKLNSEHIKSFKIDVIQHIKDKLEKRIEHKYKFEEYKLIITNIIDEKFIEYNNKLNISFKNEIENFKHNEFNEKGINELKSKLKQSNNRINILEQQIFHLCDYVEELNKNITKEHKPLTDWLNKMKNKHGENNVNKYILDTQKIIDKPLTRVINDELNDNVMLNDELNDNVTLNDELNDNVMLNDELNDNVMLNDELNINSENILIKIDEK